jgi:anti-sigma factor RsiW
MTRRTEMLRDDDVHAYIDGELDGDARAAVEAAIAADPALAETVTSYRADMAKIASVYGGDLGEPLPRRWIATIENDTRRMTWRNVGLSAVAMAATVVLVFGLTMALRQGTSPVKGDIVAEALAVRDHQIGPRTVISVRSVAEAQAENTAMTKSLAARVKVPDLSRMGYQLVGIESFDSPGHAYELIYRDKGARVFTLYMRRPLGEARFDQFAEKGLRICVWQDEQVAMVMAGKMPVAEMQHLASLVYNGVEL